MSTTNSRQLRMLIDGVLAAYGIDDLKMSIELCEAVKKFLASENPSKSRESILKDIQLNMEKGIDVQKRIEEIRVEIETRVRIRPTSREWEDFLRWAYKQESEKGENIKLFLDWWVSDEWRLSHPPINPNGWYVLWPQAFSIENTIPSREEGKAFYV